MSFFNDVNKDALSVEVTQGSAGPRVGFLENFENSYQSQALAASQFGINRAFVENVVGQRASLQAEGSDLPDSGIDPIDIARFYEDGGDESTASTLRDYDGKVDELKTRFPKLNIRNSRELWDDVRTSAQEAERRSEQSRTTIGGDIGGFIGGAVASVDPTLNPLNTATLGVGAVGKTAITRIASQFAGQGVIEAVNQVTGVQEERRLLRLSHGFDDAIARVGMSAVGGAALQGVGEAAVAGFKAAGKRWFADSPNDPAPLPPEMPAPKVSATPEELQFDAQMKDLMEGRITYDQLRVVDNPLGQSRLASSRTMMDTDYVTAKLEAWDGEEPYNLKPPTDTAVPQPVRGAQIASDFNTRRTFGRLTVDEMAREVDPKVFRIYDELVAERATLRGFADERAASIQEPLHKGELETVTGAVKDLSNRIAELKDQGNTHMSNRKRKELESRISKLEDELGANMVRVDHIAGPEVKSARERLVQIDEKMRDLAPVVSRAYARARGEWDNSQQYKQAVREMVNEGGSQVRYTPDASAHVDVPRSPSLTDKAPILQQAPRVADRMRVGADAADMAKAILDDNKKLMDESLDKYRTELNKVLKQEDGTVNIAGTEFKLHLDKDKIAMPNEDGTGGKLMSIREILEDQAETELDLEATKKCSI